MLSANAHFAKAKYRSAVSASGGAGGKKLALSLCTKPRTGQTPVGVVPYPPVLAGAYGMLSYKCGGLLFEPVIDMATYMWYNGIDRSDH